MEQALWRNLEALAMSLKASTACSLFARAVYSWTSDLAAADSNVSKELKDEIKKISLVTAFVTDASLDALHLSARAMASRVTAKCNTWLRNWEVDPLAQAKVAGVPFRGISLLGEGTDKNLVEDKDKKKALQSRKEDGKHRKCFQSF